MLINVKALQSRVLISNVIMAVIKVILGEASSTRKAASCKQNKTSNSCCLFRHF